jgi:hypothetical protein
VRDTVKRLVLEVLGELELVPGEPAKHRGPSQGPRVLVLFHSGLFRQGEALAQVAKIALQSGKVSHFQGPRARALMRGTNVKELTGSRCSLNEASRDGVVKVLERADVVVAPTLSLSVATRVARLTIDCDGSELLMSALLGGKPVIAAEDGFTKPGVALAPGLAEEVDRTLGTLAGYGVTLCPTSRLADTYAALASTGSVGAGAVEDRPGLPLVSAADISRAAQDKVKSVCVASKGIITPLAADMAKEYGVQIVRESA